MATTASPVGSERSTKVDVLILDDWGPLDVPQEVRSLGPWSVLSRGEISELVATHRDTLARQGYVVIEAHMLGFEKSLKA